MKKRVISFILAFALVFSMTATALAAEGLSNFTKVNAYPAGKFTDVAAASWYAESVKTAYELDLVKGESENRFSPDGSVNIAAAITLACRIHSIYYTGEANFPQSDPWYQVYVDYAAANGIIQAGEYANMTAKATRTQYAAIMAKALPDSALPAINTVEDNAIPDVKTTDAQAADIYKLYRAGILTGSDDKGTFNPRSDIKRSEVAALVTRMVDTNLRKSVTLNLANSLPLIPNNTVDVTPTRNAASAERKIVGEENYHGHVYTGGSNSTKYHYEAECAGKYSHEITWDEVDARNLQPCGTCVLK
ncbi:MAG: S-layer homology domain-containing protein [Firmicutes bacterium]|nr:S-layer homology domain-containing protein [Bacillota bacterium]